MKNNRVINLLPYLILLILLGSLFSYTRMSSTDTLNYGDFMKLIEKQQLEEVSLTYNSTVIDVKGVYKDKDIEHRFVAEVPNTEQRIDELLEKLDRSVKDGKITIVNPYASNYLADLLVQIVPTALLFGFGIFMISRMNGSSNNKAFEFSKSRARLEDNIKVRFEDVAGCDEEKEEMAEIILSREIINDKG